MRKTNAIGLINVISVMTPKSESYGSVTEKERNVLPKSIPEEAQVNGDHFAIVPTAHYLFLIFQ